jgi:hypothetical protein
VENHCGSVGYAGFPTRGKLMWKVVDRVGI